MIHRITPRRPAAPAPQAVTSAIIPKAPQTRFPRAWTWWVDDAIPSYVKATYSPKESWKDKPFGKVDARFFSKGIQELSALFTEDRPPNAKGMPSYFRHPKFRSSYLLYFLPLQAAKFLTLFQRHPDGVRAALEHGRRQGVLRITDLGAGPGTASLAFLLALLDLPADEGEIPPIELHWVDQDRTILQDGARLLETLSSHFPKLRGRVKLQTTVDAWWNGAGTTDSSLIFLGNVLNEAPSTAARSEAALKALASSANGGGMIFLEPAARRPSQTLSQVRDFLLDSEVLKPGVPAFWGPCPHGGRCPLATGRDWCHFSFPLRIPGEWFRLFSEGLGSERHWLKFSYIWVAGQDSEVLGYPPAPPAPGFGLAISDTLTLPNGDKGVPICEPDTPEKITVSREARIHRGDWISLGR